ncbi:hypothetical protein JCM16814_06850 [Desulfobaculum senezii]
MNACKSVKTMRDTVKGLWSLLVGLRVTGQNFVRPQLTVHYPRKTVDNIHTYHGHIELVGKPKEPAVPKCICCMLCVTSCPSGCISVIKKKEPKPAAKEGPEAPKEMVGEVKGKTEPPKKKPVKTPSKWKLDYNLCSLCGTCVEVCPVKSIRFSTDVYLAGYERNDFEYDLLARLREQAGEGGADEE